MSGGWGDEERWPLVSEGCGVWPFVGVAIGILQVSITVSPLIDRVAILH